MKNNLGHGQAWSRQQVWSQKLLLITDQCCNNQIETNGHRTEKGVKRWCFIAVPTFSKPCPFNTSFKMQTKERKLCYKAKKKIFKNFHISQIATFFYFIADVTLSIQLCFKWEQWWWRSWYNDPRSAQKQPTENSWENNNTKNWFNGEFKYCSIILCLGIALSIIPTRSPFECRKVIGFHTCYATQLT